MKETIQILSLLGFLIGLLFNLDWVTVLSIPGFIGLAVASFEEAMDDPNGGWF